MLVKGNNIPLQQHSDTSQSVVVRATAGYCRRTDHQRSKRLESVLQPAPYLMTNN